MVTLKRAIAGIVGGAIGIVTLRRLRNRRSDPRMEAESAAKEAINEASAAAEHTAASIEHARVAGEKMVEAVDDEIEGVRTVVAERKPMGDASDESTGIRSTAERIARR